MNKLGSHWRWRVVLATILIMLIGVALRTLGQRGHRKVVASGGGPPLLLEVDRYLSYSIEAWDPSSGKTWVVHTRDLSHPADDVPSFYSVRNGKGVAWIENGSLHLVDSMPPHRHETWQVHEHTYLVGLSPSGTCGVFVRLSDSFAAGPLRNVDMLVVDLRNERVVSQETVGDVRARDSAGNFDFWDIGPGNPSKTFLYRYHLDDDGTWQELTSPENATIVLSQPSVGRLTPLGNLQLLDQKAGATPVRGSPWVKSVRLSPTSNQYLATTNLGLYLGNLGALTPLELKPLFSDIWSFEFQSNGRDIAGVDDWGNVFQVNLDTGQRVAVANPGTRQYWEIFATVVLLGVIAGIWVIIACSEKEFGWGLIDAMAISWIASSASALTKIAYLPHGPQSYSSPLGRIATWMDAPLIGIGIASLYVMAWYWAHGNRHLLFRMVGGILWLAAVVTPIVVTYRFLYGRDRIPIGGFWEPMIAQAVLLTGATAFLMAAPRWFGWRLQKEVSEFESMIPKLRRFGLASLFTAITLFAIVLGLCRVLDFNLHFLSLSSLQEAVHFICALSPSLAIGLPIAFTSRSRRQLVVSILVITLGTIVELWVICGLWNDRFLGHSLARLSGAVFAALLPCLLLRRHGYHWCRATNATRSQEQAVAVA